MGKAPQHRDGRGVRLSEILDDPRFIACDDIVARGCQEDPERCRPGDVFVARSTGVGDGHESVLRAVAHGASGVIAERMVSAGGAPLCLVRDADRAQARLCHALAGDPAAALKIVAVTGTSGKTTATWLAAAVLAEAGRRVGVLSGLGCLDDQATVPEPADYAAPADLAGWLGRLAAAGCTHAVVEVSSAMLARQSLAGVDAAIVAVTNLGTAHLDLHGTPRAYRAIKARILDTLGADGCLVTGTPTPVIDRLCRRAARRCPGVGRISAGLAADCDLSATPVERGLHGQTFLLRAGDQAVPVAVDVPTAGFVADALVAAAIGLRCGVPIEIAARGIEAAGGIPGRMERLDRGQDAAVFLDAPTSGHALASSLASLRRLTPGRLAVVADDRWLMRFGAGAARRRVARWCDDCVVVPATMLAEMPPGPRRLPAGPRRLAGRHGRRGRPGRRGAFPRGGDRRLAAAGPPAQAASRPAGRVTAPESLPTGESGRTRMDGTGGLGRQSAAGSAGSDVGPAAVSEESQR